MTLLIGENWEMGQFSSVSESMMPELAFEGDFSQKSLQEASKGAVTLAMTLIQRLTC